MINARLANRFFLFCFSFLFCLFVCFCFVCLFFFQVKSIHPAVQIYEIQKINYFNAENVYTKSLNFSSIEHYVFCFFYSLQTQDRRDFCSRRLRRKRAFHKSKLP